MPLLLCGGGARRREEIGTGRGGQGPAHSICSLPGEIPPVILLQSCYGGINMISNKVFWRTQGDRVHVPTTMTPDII
eukprot:scaffold5228_cov131-Skeletonema_menzelii.AAC.8